MHSATGHLILTATHISRLHTLVVNSLELDIAGGSMSVIDSSVA